MKIIFIALNSFRKSVRKKVFMLLFLISLVIIATSHLFAFLSVEEEAKIIKDISLAAISLFGILVALFLASSEISTELERKTVRDVLAKPVRRYKFILGKFFGVLMVVALNLLIMSTVFLVVLYTKELEVNSILWKAIYFTFLELTLITAIATMFSSLTTGIISAAFTGFVYIVGHLVGYVELLSKQAGTAFVKALLETSYRVLPNLEKFNIRNAVIHDIPIPAEVIFKTTLYCLEYVAIFLIVAIVVFERKEL